MTLEEADKIRRAWGSFLEHENPILMMLFLAKIPESLLPYPKEKINEAVEFLVNLQGVDSKLVETLKSTQVCLTMYVDDNVALDNAVKNFSDESYRKAVMNSLRRRWDKQPA